MTILDSGNIADLDYLISEDKYHVIDFPRQTAHFTFKAF